jgi:epoxyqueuosine reductase
MEEKRTQMKTSNDNKTGSDTDFKSIIEKEIQNFIRTSDLNLMPPDKIYKIFDPPLIRFADGDDPIFAEYKNIIGPVHFTPREALAEAYNKKPEEMPEKLSVISWILPITEETRKSNRQETQVPSRLWVHTRWYGEQFNDALRRHIAEFLKGMRYLAAAPVIQSYFKRLSNEKGQFSNWSERHIAFAAGHGTFSLSDGFITERGIAHRCGSVVTNLKLPASQRTAKGPYSNCLFFANASCNACISRCPAGAISEKGHDKIKCLDYSGSGISHLRIEYNVGITGCGLCQVKVPCESINPTIKHRRKEGRER